MPLKENLDLLGNSKETAIRRFFQVEKRLQRQPEIRELYSQFMKEYEDLGHMTLTQNSIKTDNNTEYYLPHHPVLKESTTTKLRVVFDASAKTSTNISLNDILSVGPTIQDDLLSIILRFRTHTFVMTADIEKMYRQIWIDPSQRNLLKVLWRENPTDTLKTYKLNTVTYGTTCAPFLAIRTLRQLAEDEKNNFPEAAAVVLRDFYVDDILTGANSLETALKLQKDCIELLKAGGFNLRKWNANHDYLLQHLPEELRERQLLKLPKALDATSKTLGLVWNATLDQLQFKYQPSNVKSKHHFTKRLILSQIAQLYDPLGLASPIVIRAKLFMQELWQQSLGWDEEIPEQIRDKWLTIHDSLISLNDIKINRCVTLPEQEGSLEIHAFSDASEKAFGGAVYIKHVCLTRCKVTLLCSKSKVAPLKTVSLPRLELCGALLVSELVSHVSNALDNKISNIFYWTDSSIVLSWLAAEAASWKTFVANRVAKIHELTNPSQWRHVKSEDNPADLVSRGTETNTLLNSTQWWTGPSWLIDDPQQWPSKFETLLSNENNMLERKGLKLSATSIVNENILHNLLEKYSDLNKVQRVVAYCFRFIHNIKSTSRNSGSLSTEELTSALVSLIKCEQKIFFNKELVCLQSNGKVSKKSKLLMLNPFFDREGVIRVGGRLQNSDIPIDQKHPIVLSDKSPLTTLIARKEHLRNLHAGPLLLLAAMRQQYWPLNGRNLVRKIVHKCVTCFKVKPKGTQQVMGILPATRTIASRPFSSTGVDYCGPVFIKSGMSRKCKLVKSYISVFVCFSTKAIHLELVPNLTTEAFLAAFRRFISRRGICKDIYSDNGTNFIGANRELQDLRKLFKSQVHQQIITDFTSPLKINWHFIPPNSPHFGGLWEAGVKSVKYHLRRVTGNTNMTFDELYTTLTMIEACLNSRPLTPLSTDPSDPKPFNTWPFSDRRSTHCSSRTGLKCNPNQPTDPLAERTTDRTTLLETLVEGVFVTATAAAKVDPSVCQSSTWPSRIGEGRQTATSEMDHRRRQEYPSRN